MRSKRVHRNLFRRRASGAGCAVMLIALVLAPADAQEPGADAMARVHASRDALEALATAAEQATTAAKRAEADVIRARLRDGDFQPGDLIVVSVVGDSALTDTFTVRPQRTLDLPNLTPISLHGVLRSELQDHVAGHIARFVKSDDILAYPLIRVAVIGEVTRPGYYMLTPNRLITDAIMLAGGPTREADLTKTVVRRDTTVLWSGDDLRAAVGDGRNLAQLDLGSGDEIIVAQSKRRSWETVLRTASLVSGIVLSIYGATRIF